MRRSLAITFICLLCSCAGTQTRSQDSPTWFSKEDYAIQLPADFSQDGNYKIEIHRTFKNSREEKLLRIAEATYPNRERVLEAASGFRGGKYFEPSPEPLWWYDNFDYTRILYSITAAAVKYYWDMSEKFTRTSLDYRADINYHKQYAFGGQTYKRVYVAVMHLDWSCYCGVMCGVYLNKDRTVILSRSGKVLRVEGDQAEPYAVSRL